MFFYIEFSISHLISEYLATSITKQLSYLMVRVKQFSGHHLKVE